MPTFDDFGPITPYLSLPDVSEIMVNGPNKIFVERAGQIMPIEKRFTSESELLRVIRQLLTLAGKQLSPQIPMVDCRLTDGSRITVTMPPVTPVTSFTIRRPTTRTQDLKELVMKGTLSAEMAAFLRIAVLMRQNILISGGTSCGKTTLLNALGAQIPLISRLITIEDTFEISLPHANWVAMETVFQGRGEGGTVVTMKALLAHALHLRPDRIILGEVRGDEALEMLQAMNSGHDGSMATIHASSPMDAISRLETLVLMAGYEFPLAAVRQQISRAVNIIIQMRRTPEGSRQITTIAEVTGMQDTRIQLEDIFVAGRNRATGQVGHFPTGYVPSFIHLAPQSQIAIPFNLFSTGGTPPPTA